jgi:hypothetical protein
LLALVLGIALVAVPTAAEKPLPPVYFNHVTIFIPAATYAELGQSAFLRNEFSGFQEHTVERDGGKWSYTGIYIYGQHTYLEFFKAGQDQPRFGTTVPGQVVFNMWIDDRAQLPRYKDRLATETGTTLLIETARNAQNQPMYDGVVSEGGPASDFAPGMRVDTHIKGYYPDGITREKRLAGKFLAERQLQDITGFTLMVDEQERTRLIRQFRAYSYQISVEGAKQVVYGPGIRFTLLRAKPGRQRTLAIDFSVNRQRKGKQKHRLDDSGEIRIQGGTGKWLMRFPNE